MTKPSRYLLYTMSTAFALCCAGLIAGILYLSIATFAFHRTLESLLSNSIPYYKSLGALGIFGLLCFFAFLFSLMGRPKSDPPPRP